MREEAAHGCKSGVDHTQQPHTQHWAVGLTVDLGRHHSGERFQDVLTRDWVIHFGILILSQCPQRLKPVQLVAHLFVGIGYDILFFRGHLEISINHPLQHFHSSFDVISGYGFIEGLQSVVITLAVGLGSQAFQHTQLEVLQRGLSFTHFSAGYHSGLPASRSDKKACDLAGLHVGPRTHITDTAVFPLIRTGVEVAEWITQSTQVIPQINELIEFTTQIVIGSLSTLTQLRVHNQFVYILDAGNVFEEATAGLTQHLHRRAEGHRTRCHLFHGFTHRFGDGLLTTIGVFLGNLRGFQ